MNAICLWMYEETKKTAPEKIEYDREAKTTEVITSTGVLVSSGLDKTHCSPVVAKVSPELFTTSQPPFPPVSGLYMLLGGQELDRSAQRFEQRTCSPGFGLPEELATTLLARVGGALQTSCKERIEKLSQRLKTKLGVLPDWHQAVASALSMYKLANQELVCVVTRVIAQFLIEVPAVSAPRIEAVDSGSDQSNSDERETGAGPLEAIADPGTEEDEETDEEEKVDVFRGSAQQAESNRRRILNFTEYFSNSLVLTPAPETTVPKSDLLPHPFRESDQKNSEEKAPYCTIASFWTVGIEVLRDVYGCPFIQEDQGLKSSLAWFVQKDSPRRYALHAYLTSMYRTFTALYLGAEIRTEGDEKSRGILMDSAVDLLKGSVDVRDSLLLLLSNMSIGLRGPI